MSLSKIASWIPGNTRVMQSPVQAKEIFSPAKQHADLPIAFGYLYLLGALDGVGHVVLKTGFARVILEFMQYLDKNDFDVSAVNPRVLF